ncbi:PREDICTED: carbohydrate sulfotransferase 4-like isoform X1 [Eufriesea mexicana]|uniref:carbohydrate sulfotransferase 4-like isoform X1 n=1 Tax=Eufriesea mexicana TaxID=516756 RepID=UPI00083C7BA9|nr:PREDICTED: carbohydrate sulfotransferase 4-like isoform X1 [Eufriesea mexicana]XP_017763133.1 PREDICTED: carbohydrate sulfotransferase 4-like isoform X1 [Eufriesea mexicana]XP_017763134.1 PREDICTED: carbohydrate sulfotransferase 4-like isoform X1 [Eufriesea mexicana]
MSKRLSFYGLVGLASLCIFFLAFNQRYSSYLEHRLQPVISDVEIRPRISKIQDPVTAYFRGSIENVTLSEIQEVVDQQRKAIEREMEGYRYPNGKYGVNISKLEDLVLERGGRPMRSVILTSWRSGSTFFGDVVNAHPANFYHYEPLLDFGIVQIRGPPLADEALRNLEALLRCDFSNLDRYLEYGKTHPWVFNHNTHLWKQCQIHKKICWDPRFVSKFCKLFPFQSMKIVRLRLRAAEKLLEQDLGIRLVLLIRDPRGILQSRKHREWCPTKPDCSDPALVCADMVSDFSAAVQLIKKYPYTFRVVRYEDLSVDPYKHVKELYNFYGLDFHANVKKFLDTHTKNDVGGVSSTFRNSKVAPFHWRTDLDFEEVDEIQRVCATAMRLWGYVMASNSSHQKDFDPLIDYKLQL